VIRTVIFAGTSSQQSFVAEDDMVVTEVVGSATAIVSTNPTLTPTDLSASASDNITDDAFASYFFYSSAIFPIAKGSRVYVTLSAPQNCFVMLNIEPLPRGNATVSV
jgi:hypothetical protein